MFAHSLEGFSFWLFLIFLAMRWWAMRQATVKKAGESVASRFRKSSSNLTLYQVLQVDPHAEQEVIDAAYRRLAAKYHPDKGGDHEQMTSINEAHRVLGNAESRQEYDLWLSRMLA